jgi:hypothetical protein
VQQSLPQEEGAPVRCDLAVAKKALDAVQHAETIGALDRRRFHIIRALQTVPAR